MSTLLPNKFLLPLGLPCYQFIYIYIYIYISLFSRKGPNGCKWETTRPSLTDDSYHWHCVGDTYSEPNFFASLMGSSQPWAAWPQPRVLAVCSTNLTESLRVSVYWLRISCHYIIFLTSTHFPSSSQFTWFISAVPLFIQVHILFRNPQLTRYVTLYLYLTIVTLRRTHAHPKPHQNNKYYITLSARLRIRWLYPLHTGPLA